MLRSHSLLTHPPFGPMANLRLTASSCEVKGLDKQQVCYTCILKFLLTTLSLWAHQGIVGAQDGLQAHFVSCCAAYGSVLLHLPAERDATFNP